MTERDGYVHVHSTGKYTLEVGGHQDGDPHLPQHRFFELASLNRGARIQTLHLEDSALEWLFEERP